jgi:hypothetical protein
VPKVPQNNFIDPPLCQNPDVKSVAFRAPAGACILSAKRKLATSRLVKRAQNGSVRVCVSIWFRVRYRHLGRHNGNPSQIDGRSPDRSCGGVSMKCSALTFSFGIFLASLVLACTGCGSSTLSAGGSAEDSSSASTPAPAAIKVVMASGLLQKCLGITSGDEKMVHGNGFQMATMVLLGTCGP